MSFFSKPKVVVWPKAETVSIYLDQKENNVISFDLNLWTKLSEVDLQSLKTYFSQSKIDTCTVLIPDDIVLTKSFIYDSIIDKIDRHEVIGLAESFVPFKINPEFLEYNLVAGDNKTIIQSRIFDSHKFAVFKENIAQLGLASYSVTPVSASVTRVMATVYPQEYFLLYPLNQYESTLTLSSKDSVYLTANIKNSSPEVQKIINYSHLYFSTPINKIFISADKPPELTSTATLDKTEYSESQIAINLGKPSNVPLPVLGALISNSTKVAIISSSTNNSSSPQPSMEKKKNFLPLIAVFVATAAIASIIIWFVMNRNSSPIIEEPISDITPTEILLPTEVPTATPTIMADINKKIKIQVLNATSINGQAATLKTKLMKMGFTSVTVGNATATATANAIQLKPALAGMESYFAQNLVGFFDATITADAQASSTYDAVFTIGAKLGDMASDTTVSPDETVTTPTANVTTKVTPSPTSKLSPTVTKKLSPTPTLEP
ncbi:LytR C-terminal domain-containing protein [Candidatus Shapirobacteria bacterium]|nr:LytR C-terminal domain-containing protein [Candidatus Shapirobacteria bacterium]